MGTDDNSGIFINFSNPELTFYKNKILYTVNDGIEFQLLNPSDSKTYGNPTIITTMNIYKKEVPYHINVHPKTNYIIEITLVDNTLVAYSPFIQSDTIDKYFGLQIHHDGTDIWFSDIMITEL